MNYNAINELEDTKSDIWNKINKIRAELEKLMNELTFDEFNSSTEVSILCERRDALFYALDAIDDVINEQYKD